MYLILIASQKKGLQQFAFKDPCNFYFGAKKENQAVTAAAASGAFCPARIGVLCCFGLCSRHPDYQETGGTSFAALRRQWHAT